MRRNWCWSSLVRMCVPLTVLTIPSTELTLHSGPQGGVGKSHCRRMCWCLCHDIQGPPEETLFSLGSLSKWEEWERRERNGGWPGKALVELGGGMFFGGEAREWCLLAFDLWPHLMLEIGGWRWPQVSLLLRAKFLACVTCQGQGSRAAAANLSCPLPSCCCLFFHWSLICHFIFFSFFSCLKVTIISSVCFPTFLFLLLLYFLSYFFFSLFLSFHLSFSFFFLSFFFNNKSE